MLTTEDELMPTPNCRLELLQGTLDMLVLRTLLFGDQHGYGIAKTIQQNSDEVLQIEHGSLYPALHRLELQGWVTSKWQATGTGRRAKFYHLTAAGRKRLVAERSKWEQMASAIALVMGPATEAE